MRVGANKKNEEKQKNKTDFSRKTTKFYAQLYKVKNIHINRYKKCKYMTRYF